MPYCKVLQGIGGIRPPALPFELTSPNAFLLETAAAPQKRPFCRKYAALSILYQSMSAAMGRLGAPKH